MITDFGPIWGAAGVQGFFGEGYRHHKFLKPLGLDFTDITLVAKTSPLEKREGNMPMQKDGITAKEFMPTCIFPNFSRLKNMSVSIRMFLDGSMLNAVSLSSPGFKALFETGIYQAMTQPFQLSFMSVAKSVEERTDELEGFVELFAGYLPKFMAKVGLQINYSCPNIGINPDCFVNEVIPGLQIASRLGIPLITKHNILAPVQALKEISDSPHCAAICISNTIPWGKLPNRINWEKIFRTDTSPLAKFGGGGLSGKHLLLLVAEFVDQMRQAGITKHINAGGGILSPENVDILHHVKASSIFIGSVATLRPWRVQKIIRRAHQLFGKGNLQ
jgi:dihydroorotate dehydrogenase